MQREISEVIIDMGCNGIPYRTSSNAHGDEESLKIFVQRNTLLNNILKLFEFQNNVIDRIE